MARDYLSMWGRCRRHRAARGESPRGNWIYVAQNTSNIYVSCTLRAHLLDIIVSPPVHCHSVTHPRKWACSREQPSSRDGRWGDSKPRRISVRGENRFILFTVFAYWLCGQTRFALFVPQRQPSDLRWNF